MMLNGTIKGFTIDEETEQRIAELPTSVANINSELELVIRLIEEPFSKLGTNTYMKQVELSELANEPVTLVLELGFDNNELKFGRSAGDDTVSKLIAVTGGDGVIVEIELPMAEVNETDI
jgi:hypothetical protein